MIELLPGDCFVVRTDSPLAGLINWGQALWSQDSRAEFNHSGFVVSGDGTTFESLSRLGHYDINQYRGCPILIVRYAEMTPQRFQAAYEAVKKYDGMPYPWWRFPLHLVGLAKHIHWSFPVCSELTGRMLNKAGFTDSTGWGTTPDYWADKWRELLRYEAKKLTKVWDQVLPARE